MLVDAGHGLGALTAACMCAALTGCASSSPGAHPSVQLPSSNGTVFSVTDFGASGDGHSDNTRPFAEAISATQRAGGGTVYVPRGEYIFSTRRTPNPASVAISGSTPITLRGAGRDSTSLIQATPDKGLLGVQVDGTDVEDLTLDTRTHDGGTDMFVRAGHTRLAHVRVLDGDRHFALYYAGPKGATLLSPLYNEGNSVSDLQLEDLVCDDGFSWSFQKDSSIREVAHTGSRLALYGDQATTVTDYRYTPGAQQCGARDGFWLTPPADGITITNFSSSGEGGKVGVVGPNGAGKLATNVTIRGLTMTGTGDHITIGDVRNLVLEDCNLGGNTIVINARVLAQGIVSRCTYGQVVRNSAPDAHLAITLGP